MGSKERDVQSCKPLAYKVNPKEHFLVEALKRQFDLGVLIPMYLHVSNNINSIERHIDHEYTSGRSTVIYSIDNTNTINLISGWKGNRKGEETTKKAS